MAFNMLRLLYGLRMGGLSLRQARLLYAKVSFTGIGMPRPKKALSTRWRESFDKPRKGVRGREPVSPEKLKRGLSWIDPEPIRPKLKYYRERLHFWRNITPPETRRFIIPRRK